MTTDTTSKEALRRELLAARQRLTPAQREAFTRACQQHLQQIISAYQPKVCALFAPVRGEVSPMRFGKTVSALAEQGPDLALPVIHERGLHFVRWHPDMPMQRGAMGIAEPIERQAVQPTMVITPFVGIDQHGNRLGYGQGFYDRYFASPAGAECWRIGLGFSVQQVAQLPAEPHDITLHALITEKGIQHFPAMS